MKPAYLTAGYFAAFALGSVGHYLAGGGYYDSFGAGAIVGVLYVAVAVMTS